MLRVAHLLHIGAYFWMAPHNKLFKDVVSFWKAQLNYSVRKLQKSLSSTEATPASEHKLYCQLCGICDSLQRVYMGSDAFYVSLVSDDATVPISAICQVG